MSNRFKIEIRPHQNTDANGNNVIINCLLGGVASYSLANEPNYFWTDITNDIDNPDKAIALSWEETSNNKSKSGISSQITVTGAAFTFIYNYLTETLCSNLKSIDVKVTDNESGIELKQFLIKADTLNYKPIDGCELQLIMKEANPTWDCLTKADVYDNWQNWFNGENYPGAKQHPTFLVCVDKFASSQRLALNMLWISIPGVSIIVPITGEDDRIVRRNLGLNKFMPAPLVQDIIQNICDKCGLTQSTIFNTDSRFQKICYMQAVGARYHTEDDSSVKSPDTWFPHGNRYPILFTDFLDSLAKHYCAEWYVDNNVLHFRLKDDIFNDGPIYDFTEEAYDIEFDYGGERKNKVYSLNYAYDDGASSDTNVLYSESVNFDEGNINPMLDGKTIIQSDFASTGFVRDGTKDDYIREAIKMAEQSALIYVAQLAVIVASLFGGFFSAAAGAILMGLVIVWGITIILFRTNWMNHYADFFGNPYTGAVRLTNSENINIGRLLDWDGVDIDRAKVMSVFNPTPNTDYNTNIYKSHYSLNANPTTDSNNANNNGVDYYAFNYTQYFDNKFVGNLFDIHETSSNPLYNRTSNVEVKWKACRTTTIMNALGLYSGQYVQIGKQVKIPSYQAYNGYVQLTKIEMSGENNELIFTGKLLRK